MASIAGQERDLSWGQMVSVDQLNSVCPPFFLLLSLSPPSFRLCLTPPPLPLLLMTTYVTTHALRPRQRFTPFQVPDMMTCDDNDVLAFPCATVRFYTTLSL